MRTVATWIRDRRLPRLSGRSPPGACPPASNSLGRDLVAAPRGLTRIPLRPLTARTASATLALDADDEISTAHLDAEDTLDLPARPGLDAGACLRSERPLSPLALIAETPWWPAIWPADLPPSFWAALAALGRGQLAAAVAGAGGQ